MYKVTDFRSKGLFAEQSAYFSQIILDHNMKLEDIKFGCDETGSSETIVIYDKKTLFSFNMKEYVKYYKEREETQDEDEYNMH